MKPDEQDYICSTDEWRTCTASRMHVKTPSCCFCISDETIKAYKNPSLF